MKWLTAAALFSGLMWCSVGLAELRAGAAVVDVTPRSFPVYVNGGMTARTTSDVVTPINARAIVVSDGNEEIGIVVVDSCMMPRELLDEAKTLAARQTDLKPDHILISATHTHTAPSSMGALGTPPQEDYLPVLRSGIAEALRVAESRLEPARVGWTVTRADEFTALRRWIRRPDRIDTDPFGNPTVRANMHAAANPDDVTGESGPEDPDLSMIAFQAVDGRPIAVLANFSMHYFSGQKPLAADYFGLFSDGMQQAIGHHQPGRPPFVAMMSHGCSGDIWRRDYRLPKDQQNPYPEIETYTRELLNRALSALRHIQYSDADSVAMFEQRLTLKYRTPDQQLLEWARRVVAEMGDRLPATRPEIYAREQILLHERQQTQVVVQGLRIGDIGIASTPTETYALTGLKIKLQSPLEHTMVIELANGGDGYIPPPEQHLLGGYNTWPARSAGLEVMAEPKIAEAAVQLLERATGVPRRIFRQSAGPAAKGIAELKPIAWYRLDEFSGPIAADSGGRNIHATFEPAIARFLDGPRSDLFCEPHEVNRCVHLAGDRIVAKLPVDPQSCTISLWLWNGMPTDAREVTGWMYSRGFDQGLHMSSEHLGIDGTAGQPGRIVFQTGPDGSSDRFVGSTAIPRWTWAHVVLTRKGRHVNVYLNGNPNPEITAELSESTIPLAVAAPCFFGGRCDDRDNWEGRLDELCVFDRVLSMEEIRQLSPTSGDDQDQ